MKKLSLRSRISFWLENNQIWLKEMKQQPEQKFKIKYYEAKIKPLNIVLVYAGEEINGKTEITKISSDKYDFKCYESPEDGVYIIGTEGIFYKTPTQKLTQIFNGKDCEGIRYYPLIGIIYIFLRNKKDIIARMKYGKINKLLEEKEIVYTNDGLYRGAMRLNTREKANVIVEEGHNKYTYCAIDGEKIDYTPILVKSYKDLLEGKPVIAYNQLEECNVVVTLVEDRVKIHHKFDELQELQKNTYYLASKDDESFYHVLKYINKSQIDDIGVIPKEGNYTYLDRIFGVLFYKAQLSTGIRLISIYKNEVKMRFFEGAVNIKFSKPTIFEDKNIVGVQPIAVFEEVIED